MKIMLDCSPAKIESCRKKYDGYEFWQLRTPLRPNKLAGVPYGIDNGCFSTFKEKEWEKLLEEAREQERYLDGIMPKFVCAPDHPGSAARTLELFDVFKRRLNGLPAALVLQDGIGSIAGIKWDQLSAVFIGGSDNFKVSREAQDAASVAKMLGKYVHVGRVNSTQRALFWKDIADSCDGSGVARFADTKYDTHINNVLAALRDQTPKLPLEDVA